MKKKTFKQVAEKDYINLLIDLKDKETLQLIERKNIRTRCNIFQPSKTRKSIKVDNEVYESTSKPVLWLRRMCMWFMDMTHADYQRWWFIHLFVKKRLLYPAFKLLERLLARYMVTEDKQIYSGWWNNHIRIFRHSWHQAVDDMYGILIWNQSRSRAMMLGKEFKDTQEQFIKRHSKHQSVRWRKLMCDIQVTEMLEDTADREGCNFFMLRACHEMMMLYGISVEERKKVPLPGQFPVYLSKGPHYPEYFKQNALTEKWLHPRERDKLMRIQKRKENQQQKDIEVGVLVQKQPATVVQVTDGKTAKATRNKVQR